MEQAIDQSLTIAIIILSTIAVLQVKIDDAKANLIICTNIINNVYL